MVTSSKRAYASMPCLPGLLWLMSLTLRLGQPMTPLETPGHSQADLTQALVGSLLLSPGSWCTQGFICALQESVSPVLCKFCGGVKATSSKRAYAIPRSTAPRVPAPAAVHC